MSKQQNEPMISNPYGKPIEEPMMVQVKRFLYNPETGAFLGRTSSSWGKYLTQLTVFMYRPLILSYSLLPYYQRLSPVSWITYL